MVGLWGSFGRENPYTAKFHSVQDTKIYRIRGNFRGLPIFAVFRGQYETGKIKIAKYFLFLSKNRR